MVTKKPDPKKKDSKKMDKTKLMVKKVTSGGGSKAKKKKWSKGKVRDKLENQAFLDQAGYDKALKEVQKLTLATPAIVSEKLKIKYSVARALMKHMMRKKLLKVVSKTGSSFICTKNAKEVPPTQ